MLVHLLVTALPSASTGAQRTRSHLPHGHVVLRHIGVQVAPCFVGGRLLGGCELRAVPGQQLLNLQAPKSPPCASSHIQTDQITCARRGMRPPPSWTPFPHVSIGSLEAQPRGYLSGSKWWEEDVD